MTYWAADETGCELEREACGHYVGDPGCKCDEEDAMRELDALEETMLNDTEVTELPTLEMLEELARLDGIGSGVPWGEEGRNIVDSDGVGMVACQYGADVKLIAAMRNALPALIAGERRRLEIESMVEFLKLNGEDPFQCARELGWKSPVKP